MFPVPPVCDVRILRHGELPGDLLIVKGFCLNSLNIP